ncbi:MAG TPA: peptidylprolyl isomerase [Xanthobacteraceae bacterium]|nr:peptidylprolyl isomerase [Xanthobacteraceae bacterium]
MSQLARLLREPLLHFLLIGAALFAVYAWVNRGGSEAAAPQVRLGQADVRWLQDTFRAQYQRDPNPEELKSLVRDFVKETLFAREAQALGLDKDDIVVRRRLAQKMTFLLQDNSPAAAPSENDLHRLYEAQENRPPSSEAETGPQTMFTRPRISFAQIYFSREHRADAAADARAALQQVSQAGSGAPTMPVGDPAPMKSEFSNVDERTVGNDFGAKFAAEIFRLGPGPWQGPIMSARGVHLVQVTALIPAKLKPFDDVRDQLVEMWRAQVQRENEDRTFLSLLKKYQVVPDDSVKELIAALIEETNTPPAKADKGAAP